MSYPYNLDASIEAESGANVNRVSIEISEKTIAIIGLAIAMAAIVTSGWAIHETSKAQMEARRSEERRVGKECRL